VSTGDAREAPAVVATTLLPISRGEDEPHFAGGKAGADRSPPVAAPLKDRPLTDPADPDVRTGLARRVVGGAALASGGLILSRALTFASALVLARLARPEVFGNFAAGSIVVGSGGILVESGMLSALIHRRDRIAEAADTAFVANLLGGAALSLAALALSPVVGLLFSSRRIELVSAAMSGTLFLTATMVVPDALLQRRLSFLRRIVVDPLGVAIYGAVAIAGLATGLGVWALVIATYGSLAVQSAAAWKASGHRPKLRNASFGLWRELAGYGRHVLAGVLIDRIALDLNTFLLGRFVSPAGLGQYRYGQRFATVSQDMTTTAGQYVLFPALAHIATERERFERAFRRSLFWLLIPAVPISLFWFPLGKPFVVLLLGTPWRPTGDVLMLLGLAAAPNVIGSVCAESLKAAGRPDVLPRIHLYNALAIIVLMLALLTFGLRGIAVAAVAAAVIGGAVTLVYTIRVNGFDARPIMSIMWPAFVAGAVSAAFVFALDRVWLHAGSHAVGPGLALLLAEALAGLALYAGCLMSLSAATRSEVLGAVRSLVAGRRAASPARAQP
jgi:O-antigen/teichoic acid export membrane protein